MPSLTIPPPPRMSRRPATVAFLVLAAAVVLAILARGVTIGHPFMAGDEYAYFAHVRMAGRLGDLYAADPQIQRVSNPLFFVLGRLVCSLAGGDGTALLRLVNTVLFVAGCCVCVAFTRPGATDRDRAGLLLVLVLMPLSSYCLYFMPEILYFFLATLLTAVVVRGEGPPHGGAALATGALVGALLATKPHAVALGAALAAFIVLEHVRVSGPARGFAGACRAGALVAVGTILSLAAVTWLHQGSRPPETGDLVGRVYHGFITAGFAGRFSVATLMGILVRHLVLDLAVLAVPLLLLARFVVDLRGVDATRDVPPPGSNARGLALWSVLVFAAALLMSVVFTAIVAVSQPAEALRLHGRYYSFALPILLTAWVAAFPAIAARPWFARWAAGAAALGAACAIGRAALGERAGELYPWDYPELMGMSRWPALGWPATVLPWAVSAAAALAAVVIAWQPRTSLWATGTLLVATFVAGQVNVWRWHSDHARTQGRIADEARAVALLLGPDDRGVVVGEQRYGRMASALFGVGSGCGAVTLPALSTITSEALPPDATWVLLADRFAMDVPYEAVVEGRETTFYRLRPLGASGRREEVVGWGGGTLAVSAAAADEPSRFVGFKAREGWGRWSVLPVSRIHLPVHVAGKVVLRFSGWVATPTPQRLTIGLGTGLATVEVGSIPGTVGVPIDTGPGGAVLTFRGVEPQRANPWDVPLTLAVQRVEIVPDAAPATAAATDIRR